MARRLGVPEAACVAAEAALSQEARLLVQAIARLDETQATLEREAAQAAAEREQAAALRVRQQALVADLERKQQLLQEKLTEARALVRRLRRARREHPANRHDHLGATAAERVDSEARLAQSVPQWENIIVAERETSQPMAPEQRSPLQIGDKVETQNGRIRGELVAVHGDRARIRHGGVTFDVAAAQVHKIP